MNPVNEGQTLYAFRYSRMEQIVVDKVMPKTIKAGGRQFDRRADDDIIASSSYNKFYASPSVAVFKAVTELRERAAALNAEADGYVEKYLGGPA